MKFKFIGKKYQRKAFTLIELLAVIIILAIIALIATPIVLNIIDEARMSSLKSKYYNNIDVFRQYYANNYLSGNYDETTFICENNICHNEKNDDTINVNIEQGIVKLDKNGNVTVEFMVIDGYLLKADSNKLNTDKLLYETVTESNNNLLLNSNNTLFNLKIYGNSVQNGTPSIDTPVAIESLGDNTLNLFNVNNITSTRFTIEGNQTKVNIYAGNSSQSSDVTLKELCPEMEVGKTYVISYTTDVEAYISIGSYETANFWKSGDSKTITETDLDAVVRFGGAGTETRTIIFSNIQVQQGVEATEYEPYGKYKIPIEISGANKFKYDSTHDYFQNSTLVEQLDNGIIVQGNGTDGNNQWANGWYSPYGKSGSADCRVYLKSGQTVTISADVTWLDITNLTSNIRGIYLYGTTNQTNFINTDIEEGVTKRESVTYTVSEDGYYYPVFTLNSSKVKIENIQFSISEDITYEPYIEPKTYNIFLDEPLRKIGEYSDYIDFSTGLVVRAIDIVDLGTLTWSYRTNTTNYFSSAPNQVDFKDNYGNNVFSKEIPDILCNSLTVDTGYVLYNKTASVPSVSHYVLNSNKRIAVYYDGFADTDAFTSAMEGTLLYYVLETPKNAETFEVPTIPLNGTLIINVNTKIKPSSIEMQYYENK